MTQEQINTLKMQGAVKALKDMIYTRLYDLKLSAERCVQDNYKNWDKEFEKIQQAICDAQALYFDMKQLSMKLNEKGKP
jgi:hypothetical protein